MQPYDYDSGVVARRRVSSSATDNRLMLILYIQYHLNRFCLSTNTPVNTLKHPPKGRKNRFAIQCEHTYAVTTPRGKIEAFHAVHATNVGVSRSVAVPLEHGTCTLLVPSCMQRSPTVLGQAIKCRLLLEGDLGSFSTGAPASTISHDCSLLNSHHIFLSMKARIWCSVGSSLAATRRGLYSLVYADERNLKRSKQDIQIHLYG